MLTFTARDTEPHDDTGDGRQRLSKYAEQQAAATQAKLAAREQRAGSAKGGVPKVPMPVPEQARPTPKAQRNFTDPASRVMRTGRRRDSSKPVTRRWSWMGTRKSQ